MENLSTVENQLFVHLLGAHLPFINYNQSYIVVKALAPYVETLVSNAYTEGAVDGAKAQSNKPIKK